MSSFHSSTPRFITPIFIHAGFVHIALNLFAQLSLSAQIEREMGTGGFFFTFVAAGIFGYADFFAMAIVNAAYVVAVTSLVATFLLLAYPQWEPVVLSSEL